MAVFDGTVFDGTVFDTGGGAVQAVADAPVEALAGAAAVGNLPVEFLDTQTPVEAIADAPVEGLAGVAAVADAPVEFGGNAEVEAVADAPVHWVGTFAVAADLPVEALGRDPFDLALLWNELRTLGSPLLLSWLEVPRELANAELVITWVERARTVGLVLTWSELPATLQALAEGDIQRPYGRAGGTP